jgi:cell division control protein 45
LHLKLPSHPFNPNSQQYGLDKLEYTSFNRVTGYKSLISAGDMSYAVSALLESESPDAFHAAFDALNAKAIPSSALTEGYSVSNLVNGGNMSSGGIGAGLQKAMTMQKEIVAAALGLIERKAITRLRHFRYAFITCTSQESKDSFLAANQAKHAEPKHHVFSQPLALTRLAHWLMDMHRENGKWIGNKSRPLVLCAENPATKSYLVVGYEFPDRHGMFLKNHFGQHFRMTCSSMQGSFRLDSFDSHVVEVGANDVQRFIEQLHYMMDSV